MCEVSGIEQGFSIMSETLLAIAKDNVVVGVMFKRDRVDESTKRIAMSAYELAVTMRQSYATRESNKKATEMFLNQCIIDENDALRKENAILREIVELRKEKSKRKK